MNNIYFNPALTRVSYIRISVRYQEKRYRGAFILGDSAAHFTHKTFKKAFDAECYARTIMARYRRLLEAKEQVAQL
jgi:hypothetical protein